MIKVGVYASYFGKDEPKAFPDVEAFIDLAYELRLDAIDFRANVGFSARDPNYLLGIKIKCLKAGLPIGYLASGGHFVGTEDELRAKVERAKADVEMATFLGAPMIRLFCGAPEEGVEESEIKCFQEVCDFAADAGDHGRLAKSSVYRGRCAAHTSRYRPRKLYFYIGYRPMGRLTRTEPWRGRSNRGHLSVYGTDSPICILRSGQNLQNRQRSRGMARLLSHCTDSEVCGFQRGDVHYF